MRLFRKRTLPPPPDIHVEQGAPLATMIKSVVEARYVSIAVTTVTWSLSVYGPENQLNDIFVKIIILAGQLSRGESQTAAEEQYKSDQGKGGSGYA